MYPSHDLNPIAIDHMLRSRQEAYERFVDRCEARAERRWTAGIRRLVPDVWRWRGGAVWRGRASRKE
jgi:hypothetical protein